MSATMDVTEQAANLTSEFISGLDNLPKEVQHLLAEIRERDVRVQDISNNIIKLQQQYLRPVQPPRYPYEGTRARIEAGYAELHRLADDKVALAQRVAELLGRTCARLEGELLKVRRLTGEAVEPPVAGPTTRSAGGGGAGSVGGWGAALEGMLGAAAGVSVSAVGQAEEPLVVATPPRRGAPRKRTESRDGTPDGGQPMTKRRKHGSVAGTPTQIRLDSPAPAPPSSAPSTGPSYQRSRLSRQVEPDPDPEADDEDAEGEEDEEEDQTLYCFCRTKSHGDMIGCDNDDCPYQWFHLSCVNLKPPLPDQWFCPECAPRMKKRKR
ncbi:hypothetical protein HDZ31DRAFT_64711 [Schizophyllum fasciatum]